jgi:pre-mRNA branch site protein p14
LLRPNPRIMSRVQQPTRGMLPSAVNRAVFVRNLPYKITAEEIYCIFGRYGALRQVRVGSTPETKGTAFIVYEDIYDAAQACEHLSGFSVGGRYLVVTYFAPPKVAHAATAMDLEKEKAEVEALRQQVAAGAGGEALDEEGERKRLAALRRG